MGLTRINNNVSAINANRNLTQVGFDLSRSLERLSSGLRINRAADDAAGLSISETQRSQIRGLNRAIANAQDAIGLINTAEGALNETTSRLQRIRELAVQALNSGGSDPAAIQAAQDEIETSIQEITRIGDTTQFSTRILINGDNDVTTAVRQNTPGRGISVAQTAVASSLPDGVAFLRITQSQVGTEFVTAGSDGVGNANISAIAGSTFATGQYTVRVSNVQAAATQVVSTGLFENAGGIAGTDELAGSTLGGTAIATGDALTIQITQNDGTVATITSLTGASTFADLLTAVNTALTGTAAAFFDPALGGTSTAIMLTAGATGTSSLGITISIDSTGDSVADFTDVGTIDTLGTLNSAVVNVGDGVAQTVNAGDTVTLFGREPTDGSPTPRVTLTFDSLISEGSDLLNVVSNEYTASLNGGRAVTFTPGDQEVLFRTGTAAGFNSGDFLVLNFADTIDLGGTPAVGLQATVTLSTVNNGLVFQIGANEGQNLTVGFGDLRASNLGFVEGLNVNGTVFEGTVDSIDVRTQEGAENAVRIVDRALSQVSRQRSFLGATTNRLEATIANLGVASENLTAAESRIRDADIAYEATQFARNQILTQTATASLAQANLAPQLVLQLIA